MREDLVQPDPLLDCLVEVCRVHGLPASRASLTAGLPVVGGQLDLELAERAAARAGLSARVQRMALDDIDRAVLPAILILKGNRACVLGGWSDDGQMAEVLLPETGHGRVTLSREELLARFTGLVLYVRPPFRFDKRAAREPEIDSQSTHPLARHWFWGAILEQRGLYKDVLLAALLINLFALALPLHLAVDSHRSAICLPCLAAGSSGLYKGI